MEVDPPAILASVTTVTNSKQAPESQARWRPWFEPLSKWLKRKRAVCSSKRFSWTSQDSPKLTVHVSLPPYPITLSSPCLVLCAVVPEPPAWTFPMSASTTGTASKCSGPMTMMKTQPVLLLCLDSAALALMESPDQAFLSPKTTCQQICPPTLLNPRWVRSSIQFRRGSHWTGKQLTPWPGIPWSTSMTQRTYEVTPAWRVEESSTTWHLMLECRLSRYRDTRQPQSS